MIEVEEEPETAYVPDVNEESTLMTQGQWMKGCPEGGEQSFLFSLYRELGEGDCAGRGHLSGGKEETLKRGVEGECSAKGLDLSGGSVGHVYADGANKHARLRVLGRNRGSC